MNAQDIQRGEIFASNLYATVHRDGPRDLSPAEKEALAAHLLSTTISWVQARNRGASLTEGAR